LPSIGRVKSENVPQALDANPNAPRMARALLNPI